jgi:hypothetical protein
MLGRGSGRVNALLGGLGRSPIPATVRLRANAQRGINSGLASYRMRNRLAKCPFSRYCVVPTNMRVCSLCATSKTAGLSEIVSEANEVDGRAGGASNRCRLLPAKQSCTAA